jgi:hypothetical protein
MSMKLPQTRQEKILTIKQILFCNDKVTCIHFDALKAMCMKLGKPVDYHHGGHVGSPRHIYKRRRDCPMPKPKAAVAPGMLF